MIRPHSAIYGQTLPRRESVQRNLRATFSRLGRRAGGEGFPGLPRYFGGAATNTSPCFGRSAKTEASRLKLAANTSAREYSPRSPCAAFPRRTGLAHSLPGHRGTEAVPTGEGSPLARWRAVIWTMRINSPSHRRLPQHATTRRDGSARLLLVFRLIHSFLRVTTYQQP